MCEVSDDEDELLGGLALIRQCVNLAMGRDSSDTEFSYKHTDTHDDDTQNPPNMTDAPSPHRVLTGLIVRCACWCVDLRRRAETPVASHILEKRSSASFSQIQKGRNDSKAFKEVNILEILFKIS